MSEAIERLWETLTMLTKGKEPFLVNRVDCILTLHPGSLYLTKYGEIYDAVNHTVYKFKNIRDLFEAEIDVVKVPPASVIISEYGDILSTLTWGTYILSVQSGLPISYFTYDLLGDVTGLSKAELYALAVTSGIGKDMIGPMGPSPTLYTETKPIYHIQYPFNLGGAGIHLTRIAVQVPSEVLLVTPVAPDGVGAITEAVYGIPMLGSEYVIGESGVIYKDSVPVEELSEYARVNLVLGDYAAFVVDSWFITALATGRLRRNIDGDFVRLYAADDAVSISPTNVDEGLVVVNVTTAEISTEVIIGAV